MLYKRTLHHWFSLQSMLGWWQNSQYKSFSASFSWCEGCRGVRTLYAVLIYKMMTMTLIAKEWRYNDIRISLLHTATRIVNRFLSLRYVLLFSAASRWHLRLLTTTPVSRIPKRCDACDDMLFVNAFLFASRCRSMIQRKKASTRRLRYQEKGHRLWVPGWDEARSMSPVLRVI